MLKNQEAEQPAQSPTAQSSGAPRVTPAELNAALAAIEARKQAEASRLAGTIPIDQAISDLHLDSTTDEIWAEVQAQRAAATKPPHAAPPAAALPLDALRQRLQSASETKQQKAEARRSRPHPWWTGILAPVLIGWVLIQTGVVPHSWTHSTTSPAVSTAAPILRPLAQIPTDIEVYADSSALAQVSAGTPLSQITVSENVSGNRWKIVKRSGHVYLRGYIARADSLQSLQNQPLTIYSGNDSGELEDEHTSNITLRVDKIPLSNPHVGDDYLSVTVPNFQPDPLTTLDPGS